jgi:TatD DNase family protein
MWIDSHCHLQSLRDPDGALERARAAEVERIVCVGTDLETSRAAVELALRHPNVVATVGLHPHEASSLGVQWDELATLARTGGAVAVGETGLDFHYLHSPADAQEAAFRRHIQLAKELDTALVVHSREAWDDTFRVLAEEGAPAATVLHCFTGGPAEARRALDAGAYVSFSGIATFRSAGEVRDAAALVPLDRLLVETDAPYLAPEPHRGRENEPAWVAVVGEALAQAIGRSVAEVAAATATCAIAAFSIPRTTPGNYN